MTSGRLAIAALVLWGVTVMVVGVTFYRSHRTTHASSDARTVIALPSATRDSVLAEMRAMLASVNEILNASARGDTAALRAAAQASGPAQAMAKLERLPGVAEVALFGDRLHVVLADPSAATILDRALSSAGCGDADLREIVPSLEDVFIRAIATAERGAR